MGIFDILGINKYVVIGLISVALLGWGFWWLNSIANNRLHDYQQEESAQRNLINVLISQRDSYYQGLTDSQATKAKTVTQYVTQGVATIETRTIYSNECLDADGLQYANAALTNTAPTTSQHNGEVSKPDTTK